MNISITRYQFAALLFGILVALSLVAFFCGEKNFFVGNLVPELIGVSVELLIIIFVFDAWQKNEERNKKIDIERRLREFLVFFLKNNFKSFPHSCQPGNFYGEDHEQNQTSIDNLISNIEQHELSEDVILMVQKYCSSEREIFNNLIPVASGLTRVHFKSWVRISYFMNAIASKGEKTSYAVVKILHNIKRFDKESYENKLYVGASKSK